MRYKILSQQLIGIQQKKQMKRVNGIRQYSNSMSPHHHQIQRQRSRDKKNKVQYYIGPDLHLTKHFYFSIKDQKNIGYVHAAWNFCVAFGRKPFLSLIVCDNQNQISQLLNFNKLNKKLIILADHDSKPLKDLMDKDHPQIVIMTTKKASILYNIQESTSCFSLILNIGFHRDLDHYRKLHQFIIKTGGTIISFVNHRRDLQKIQDGTGVNFSQLNGNISDEQINKDILSNIQFMPTPKIQTCSTLKCLPFSNEQISARIFELLKNNYISIDKSKYLGLIGYITYQVKTDVQFNSHKYIWNYFKDTLPQDISSNVRSMVKFKDGRGAIFNIPAQNRYQMDKILRKLKKRNKQKTKFQISVVHQLPQIEDVQSQQYKIAVQKKAYAMKNKNELQIFISGLPIKAGQQDIKAFFQQHNVNPITIRLIKDRQGQSRGICFILCQDQQHLKRSLKLDQCKFGDRTIRINLAQQKQRRRYD